MTKEEIAMQLVSLYAIAAVHNYATADHKRAVASAILNLGYQWEPDAVKEGEYQ